VRSTLITRGFDSGEDIHAFIPIDFSFHFTDSSSQTASTWSDTFETLLDAYKQIGEHMPMLLKYQELFEHNENMRTVLVLIYEDILMFHAKALCFFSGRGESERSPSVKLTQ